MISKLFQSQGWNGITRIMRNNPVRVKWGQGFTFDLD